MKRAKDLTKVRQLVLQYGWNATAYQLLNPGIRHWFAPGGNAVVGYVNWRGVWVVAGAPVCVPEDLDAITRRFEAHAARSGKRVCYFGAAGRMMELGAEEQRYSSVVLGSQPVWEPKGWDEIVAGHASLRAQLNRARNKGLSVREWPVEEAHNHPALRRLLAEWLRTRGLPSLHFLVEPQTLSTLFDRRIFVAEQNGVPVGFLVASPIPRRNGWLTEQFVRGKVAPNGTIDLLMDTVIRTVAAEGADYITMGLVPLSQRGLANEENPFWLALTLRWIRAHGRRFYNFDGLETFKSKFRPHRWEPIWVISRETHFSPGTLWAIAGAFGRQPPARLLLRGLFRAVGQEYAWYSERRSDRKAP